MSPRRMDGLPVGDRLRDVSPIIVAHGTRSPHGVGVIAEIAAGVSERIGVTRTAFVDVLGPTPSEVIADLDRPAVLVPAFLASGYHVRQDIPAHVADAGRSDTIVTRALGPDHTIAAVLRLRLIEAGWRPGDVVVLAAAGSSDESACGQVHLAARQLENLIGGRIEVGFITTASPAVPDVVAAVRRGLHHGGGVHHGGGLHLGGGRHGVGGRLGRRRVVITSYLLAPGLFHERLHTYGADIVTEPLGADPRICDLIVTRMRAVVSPYRRRASTEPHA